MDNRKAMVDNIDDVIRYKKAQEIQERIRSSNIENKALFRGMILGMILGCIIGLFTAILFLGK